MVKRVAILIAVLVAAIAGAQTASSSQRGERSSTDKRKADVMDPRSRERKAGKPKVACWNKGFPPDADPRFYVAPKNCYMLRRGATAAYQGNVAARSMKWRWGQRRAKGKGKIFISTVGALRVRVRLRNPVRSCGRRVFSTVTFRYREPANFPGPANAKGSFHLYTCG
jgi:hypothetical protein